MQLQNIIGNLQKVSINKIIPAIKNKTVAGIFLHLTTERMFATITNTEQMFCTNIKYCIW